MIILPTRVECHQCGLHDVTADVSGLMLGLVPSGGELLGALHLRHPVLSMARELRLSRGDQVRGWSRDVPWQRDVRGQTVWKS